MGLFSKNNNDKELIETMGPIPEGYHFVKLIVNEASSASGELQQKVIKKLRKQCLTENLDGFCNYRITSHFDSVRSCDVIYAFADGIMHD